MKAMNIGMKDYLTPEQRRMLIEKWKDGVRRGTILVVQDPNLFFYERCTRWLADTQCYKPVGHGAYCEAGFYKDYRR